MKLSVFYDHLRQAREQSSLPMEEILRRVKAAGIDGVDVSADDLGCGETVRLLSGAGLEVASVFCEYDWTGGEYESEERLRRHIDRAAACGAKSVLMVPGYLSPEESSQLRCAGERTDEFMRGSEAVQKTAEMLRRAVKYGAEHGVFVTLEDFDNRLSPCAGMRELLWYTENVPGLKITFDTGNFAFVGEDALQALALLENSIVHVHVKDRTADGQNAAVGCGCIPIAECVKRLKAAGVSPWLTVEHDALPGQLECVLQSAAYLKSL